MTPGLPSMFFRSKGSELRFVSTKSGEKAGAAKLPPEICMIHRRYDGKELFGNFSYSLLGDAEEGLVVVKAKCMRLTPTSGMGVATAIYGCGFDGTIKWCAKVELTHSLVCAKAGEERFVLVEDKGKSSPRPDLVGIDSDGHELFRVDPGLYDKILTFNNSAGDLHLIVCGAQFACYKLGEKSAGSAGRKSE